MIPIAAHIGAYLRDYLEDQRGASENTISSYSTGFILFFNFASAKLNVTPSQLCLENIDSSMVTDFLTYLEEDRGNMITTRNVRLAAIKSFFRFLEHRVPKLLDQIRSVLAIPFKKTDSRLVPYLNEDEVKALLDVPNPSTWDGIRDRAMLHLAVTGGLRVSELIGLRMEDLTLQPTPSILVHGKGRKERALPLFEETATALRAWLAVREQPMVPEIFVNAKRDAFSRWGFPYIVKKHAAAAAETCPSLLKKRVSPHVLRHTCAMTILEATQDIRRVALWLGHSSTQTTEVYTRADPSEKLAAINSITPPQLRKGVFRLPDKLIALLKGTTLCGAKTNEDGAGGASGQARSP